MCISVTHAYIGINLKKIFQYHWARPTLNLKLKQAWKGQSILIFLAQLQKVQTNIATPNKPMGEVIVSLHTCYIDRTMHIMQILMSDLSTHYTVQDSTQYKKTVWMTRHAELVNLQEKSFHACFPNPQTLLKRRQRFKHQDGQVENEIY